MICKVHSSGYNQTEINRLQTYRQETNPTMSARYSASYVDAALDSENQEIANLAQQVRTLVQGRGVGSLGNLENSSAVSLTVRKTIISSRNIPTTKPSRALQGRKRPTQKDRKLDDDLHRVGGLHRQLLYGRL